MQIKRSSMRRVPVTMFTAAVVGSSVLFLAVPNSWGSILAPGAGPTVTPGTASLAGLALVTDETVPFTGVDSASNEVFQGNLESRVYSDPSTGGLDFAYQIDASAPEPDSIHTVAITSFAKYSTDVDYVSSTGTVTYGTVARASTFNGFKLAFNYSADVNAIAPGDSTDWILVKTNAHAYDALGGAAISDGGSANISIYEPVPEPASLTLLVISGGLMLVRRQGTRR
jgi:hypothetical protein